MKTKTPSATKPTTFTINTKVEIPLHRVADMLCCAFEGGSNYWCVIKKTKAPEKFDFRFMPDLLDKPCSYTDYPTNQGGYLIVGDIEGDEEDAMLNLASIHQGLQVMAEKYPRHFTDLLNDNDDAETGDVFLQCCLWGDAIFG